ncbi:hypothetical protein [Burkholderia pseudomallei]|uniref:hypothetical protein n=1 Tax=Burkholderia pseudomallei TaxID=28450 RepID=UPI0013E96F6F|nr:hypothetical protein [Burkholderia pseudomallei]
MDISILKAAHANAYVRGDKAAQERLAWAISYAIAGEKEAAKAIYDEVMGVGA